MKKIFLFLIIFFYSFNSFSEELGKFSKLKIPRFVSTKTLESNLRIGADISYPILIQYKFKNIPLQITDEYNDWRKIIDFEGNVGWMHKRLLKGNRFAIIAAPYKEPVQIYNKPQGKTVGKIGKRNIVKIIRCLNKWCLVEINQKKGWISKNNLWGVYEKEVFKIPFYQFLINIYWKII